MTWIAVWIGSSIAFLVGIFVGHWSGYPSGCRDGVRISREIVRVLDDWRMEHKSYLGRGGKEPRSGFSRAR